MSHISRRHFLQFAGSTFATLGLSHLDIIQQGNRYAQVLAQSTPRKLALLVGINQYPNSERFLNLGGCVTDVKLQQELLIHRFGFNSKDILILTDETTDKPTRNNILKAFEDHLIKQAKPGDAIVFHFSGHGSRLPELDPIKKCIDNNNYNSTLVPADEGQKDIAQDIMGRTLFLLMSALKTDNVTAVLDSCYSGGGTRGNFRVRSLPGEGLKPSPEEIAYQQRWMSRLGWDSEELAKRRCAGVAKGVVIASSQRNQEAADVTFNGFEAGAFTYLLTQYLWQEIDSVGNALAKIVPTMRMLYSQAPLADGKSDRPVYFIPQTVPPADAVITQVKGNRATLWLGGIEKESLEAFVKGATFTVVNEKGQTSGKLELESRRGLVGEATLTDGGISLKPGMLLQETSRVIPANLKLSIGLDPSLETETDAASQALSAIKRLEIIPAQPGNVPYPAGVQYIFSRMTADIERKLQHLGFARCKQSNSANLPAVGSLGLFTEGLEVVSESFGEVGETVTEAVTRLEPTLKSLIASYIIKKTLNAKATNLDVEVSLNLVDEPSRILAKTVTGRRRDSRGEAQPIYPNKLPLDKLFQFQVTNNSSSDLYLTTLLIDSSGGLIVVFPYQWPATDESMRLAPQQTRAIGDPKELRLKALDKGTGEVLVIVSTSPLKRAVKTLVALAAELKRSRGGVELREPVEAIEDLLEDLTSDRGGLIAVAVDSASESATLSITFEVG